MEYSFILLAYTSIWDDQFKQLAIYFPASEGGGGTPQDTTLLIIKEIKVAWQMLNQIGEATWILEMVGDDTFLGSAEDTTSL